MLESFSLFFIFILYEDQVIEIKERLLWATNQKEYPTRT
jgi:hypothetical protein